MGETPYADTHYGTVRIILDIAFEDGTFKRGVIAHSIKFEPWEHWSLKIYKTLDDVFRQNPILYCGVKNIEVIGLLDSPKVFRDTAQQTKAFTNAVQHKVYKEEQNND